MLGPEPSGCQCARRAPSHGCLIMRSPFSIGSDRRGGAARRPRSLTSLPGRRVHRFVGPSDHERHLQDSARLFGRTRHLHHPEVVAGHLPLRSRHVHRGPRAGRGARAGSRQGGGARGLHDLCRGPPGGVRPRLRVPDVPGQRDLRRRVSAGHFHRPAPHRQASGGDRGGVRRRRGRPRGDRKGQRPGPLRAQRLRAQPGHPRGRAVAGMGPALARAPDGLCGGTRHSDRAPRRQRVTVLHRRQPAAHLLRGQRARRPLDRARRENVALDPIPGSGSRRCRATSSSSTRAATSLPSTGGACRPRQ